MRRVGDRKKVVPEIDGREVLRKQIEWMSAVGHPKRKPYAKYVIIKLEKILRGERLTEEEMTKMLRANELAIDGLFGKELYRVALEVFGSGNV